MAIKSDVKKFETYGNGWLFDNKRRDIGEEIDIDLSKISFGKGYTLFIQHFGVVDPIFGDMETDSPWMLDTDFIKYLLSSLDLEEKFYNYIKDRNDDIIEIAYDKIADYSKDIDIDVLVNLVEEIDPTEYFPDFFTQALGIAGDAADSALCGIVDEDYFTDCFIKAGYADDPLVKIVMLG